MVKDRWRWIAVSLAPVLAITGVALAGGYVPGVTVTATGEYALRPVIHIVDGSNRKMCFARPFGAESKFTVCWNCSVLSEGKPTMISLLKATPGISRRIRVISCLYCSTV